MDPQDKKRQRLYYAAEPVFERFGFRKTTIEDICKSAGMSKRTFYELFRDKADLFTHMLLNLLDSMMIEWRNRNKVLQSAEEKLAGYLNLYVEVCQAHPIYKLIFEENDLFHALVSSMTESMILELNRGLTEVIESGIASGEFSDQDPTTSAWLIHFLLDSSYLLFNKLSHETDPLIDKDREVKIRSFIRRALGYGPNTQTEFSHENGGNSR